MSDTTEEDWERVGVALSEQDSACLTVFDRREAALDREALDRLKARMNALKEDRDDELGARQRVEARVERLRAALNQCEDHVDRCCAAWCSKCKAEALAYDALEPGDLDD